MKVLVVGSGGRESALVAALVRDPARRRSIVCAPGNPGTERYADNQPLDLGAPDVPGAIADLAERIGADLTIVGPRGAAGGGGR